VGLKDRDYQNQDRPPLGGLYCPSCGKKTLLHKDMYGGHYIYECQSCGKVYPDAGSDWLQIRDKQISDELKKLDKLYEGKE